MPSWIATRLHQDTGRFGAAGLGKGGADSLKRLGQCFFPEFSKIQKKQWPTERIFRTSPPGLLSSAFAVNLHQGHGGHPLGCWPGYPQCHCTWCQVNKWLKHTIVFVSWLKLVVPIWKWRWQLSNPGASLVVFWCEWLPHDCPAVTQTCTAASQPKCGKTSRSTQSQRATTQLDCQIFAKIAHMYCGHAQSHDPICANCCR